MPYTTGQYNPLYNPTNQGFFHGSYIQLKRPNNFFQKHWFDAQDYFQQKKWMYDCMVSIWHVWHVWYVFPYHVNKFSFAPWSEPKKNKRFVAFQWWLGLRNVRGACHSQAMVEVTTISVMKPEFSPYFYGWNLCKWRQIRHCCELMTWVVRPKPFPVF